MKTKLSGILAVLAVLAGLVWCGVLAAVGANPPTAQIEATAEVESSGILPEGEVAPILPKGSKSLIWYSGAPQLQEFHDHLFVRLTELDIQSEEWTGWSNTATVRKGFALSEETAAVILEELDGRDLNKPYDLLVLAANNQEQLDEWKLVAPNARVVLAVVPEDDDVYFKMAITLDVESQPRIVEGFDEAGLLAQIDAAEVTSLDVADASVQMAMIQPLRTLIQCIYAALGDLDVDWSITFGPGGQIQYITISGNGLGVLYNILACW